MGTPTPSSRPAWPSGRRHCPAANATLQEQSGFLQRLLDGIPSPHLLQGCHRGRTGGCNAAFAEYHGLPREAIIGQDGPRPFPHPTWPSSNHAKDLELFRQPGLQVYEAQIRYADGTRNDVIFNKATLHDATGAVTGLVGTILDITARKGGGGRAARARGACSRASSARLSTP